MHGKLTLNQNLGLFLNYTNGELEAYIDDIHFLIKANSRPKGGGGKDSKKIF